MKRLFGVCVASSVALAASTFSCGKPTDTQADAGAPEEIILVNVSGTVSLHPAAVDYYAQKKITALPTVEGLKLTIEEPFLAFTKSKDAVLATVPKLAADGKFAVEKVSTKPIVLGLIAVLNDERPVGTTAGSKAFVTSASALYEGKPSSDVANTRAYAVPLDFMNALSTAAGFAADNTLEKQGFILGIVQDKDGKAVADVAVASADVNLTADKILYFKSDFSAKQETKTSANGIFVVAGKNAPSNFTVTGKSEFGQHKAGSSEGSTFLLIFKSK
jgi:hypothetical protein